MEGLASLLMFSRCNDGPRHVVRNALNAVPEVAEHSPERGEDKVREQARLDDPAVLLPHEFVAVHQAAVKEDTEQLVIRSLAGRGKRDQAGTIESFV